MSQTVYAVFKNSDMTEGRGPMVLESLWKTEEAAKEYANDQRGVMGRKPFSDHAKIRELPYWADKEKPEALLGECEGWFCKFCHRGYGDWQTKEMELRG